MHPLPFVDMAVPGGAANSLRAQSGERIALGIEAARGRRRDGRMEQFAVLGDGEEDQAIDEPQQLAEEVAERRVPLRRRAREAPGSRSETQCRALAARSSTPSRKPIARSKPFLARRLAPALQCAIGRRSAGRAKPARMDEQPERSEIREAVGLENLPEVGLDVGGAREARVGAHQPQTLAIAAKAP